MGRRIANLKTVAAIVLSDLLQRLAIEQDIFEHGGSIFAGRAAERYQVSPVLMEKAIEYLRTKVWPIGGLQPRRLRAKVIPWESSRKYKRA
jgi:hypothetical protein